MSTMLSEATEQVMAERRAQPKDREAYPCEGSCGLMLRPWRRMIKDFPNTKMEYSAQRCQSCWIAMRREEEPDNPEFALFPCAQCKHPTRPTKEVAGSAPGTRRRIGDVCQECNSRGPEPKQTTETVAAGLEKFMAVMRSNAAKVHARSRR